MGFFLRKMFGLVRAARILPQCAVRAEAVLGQSCRALTNVVTTERSPVTSAQAPLGSVVGFGAPLGKRHAGVSVLGGHGPQPVNEGGPLHLYPDRHGLLGVFG